MFNEQSKSPMHYSFEPRSTVAGGEEHTCEICGEEDGAVTTWYRSLTQKQQEVIRDTGHSGIYAHGGCITNKEGMTRVLNYMVLCYHAHLDNMETWRKNNK